MLLFHHNLNTRHVSTRGKREATKMTWNVVQPRREEAGQGLGRTEYCSTGVCLPFTVLWAFTQRSFLNDRKAETKIRNLQGE